MREEYVSLSNIEISNLIKEIKKYFIDLKLDIIHEEKFDKFSSIKAYRNKGVQRRCNKYYYRKC
jgi:hypothetical protein